MWCKLQDGEKAYSAKVPLCSPVSAKEEILLSLAPQIYTYIYIFMYMCVRVLFAPKAPFPDAAVIIDSAKGQKWWQHSKPFFLRDYS